MALRALTIWLLTLAIGLSAVDSAAYTQKLAMVDPKDPESVYELAAWCRENGLTTKADKHFREVVALNPEHAPAREALGYVMYKGKWTHKARLPADALAKPPAGGGATPAATGGGGDGPAAPSGPGPKASEIRWELTVPEGANPNHTDWVQQNITETNSSGNYSNKMEIAYRTLLKDEYWPTTVPLLCEALLKPDHRDIFAACAIITEVIRGRDHAKLVQARLLVPFIVKASERVSDPEDLQAMCQILSFTAERRAVPRLIDLLASGPKDVQADAKTALSDITLMSEASVTPESAQRWWDTYHAASDERVYGESLRSNDLGTVVKAADRLTPKGWKLAIPALIRVIREGDSRTLWAADDLLQRLTGSSWLSGGSVATPEDRKKKADLLEKWWNDTKKNTTFLPPELKAAQADAAVVKRSGPARDPLIELVGQLGSNNSTEASRAEGMLRNHGAKAIGPLIRHGLTSADGIVRQKAHDILREVSKQDFGYKPLTGTDAERSDALTKWKDWAAGAGHDAGAAAPATEEGGETAPPKDEPRKPLP